MKATLPWTIQPPKFSAKEREDRIRQWRLHYANQFPTAKSNAIKVPVIVNGRKCKSADDAAKRTGFNSYAIKDSLAGRITRTKNRNGKLVPIKAEYA